MVVESKPVIALIVLIAIISSFFTLYFVNDIVRPYYDGNAIEKLWYSQQFNPKYGLTFFI